MNTGLLPEVWHTQSCVSTSTREVHKDRVRAGDRSAEGVEACGIREGCAAVLALDSRWQMSNASTAGSSLRRVDTPKNQRGNAQQVASYTSALISSRAHFTHEYETR